MVTRMRGRAKDDSPESPGNPWEEYSQELSLWAWDRLAIKRDRHGQYSVDGSARWTKGDFAGLTANKLVEHFGGKSTLGLGVTSVQDECLWVAWDLDNHVSDRATNQNLMYAIVVMNRLTEAGFRPIVEDSDGKGGVHIWVLFSKVIPSKTAYEFARWAVRDSTEHNIDKIECFPKSSTVQGTTMRCGNYVRIPGKHHKREHWSIFWGDGEWLNVADSVQLLLHHKGVDPENIALAMFSDVFDGIEAAATPDVAAPELVNPPS